MFLFKNNNKDNNLSLLLLLLLGYCSDNGRSRSISNYNIDKVFVCVPDCYIGCFSVTGRLQVKQLHFHIMNAVQFGVTCYFMQVSAGACRWTLQPTPGCFRSTLPPSLSVYFCPGFIFSTLFLSQIERQAAGVCRLKLGDFGLAMVVTEPVFTICGTPTYVAPEILCETGR